MSDTQSFVGINDIDATELPDYRPIFIPALFGLMLGILSFLAFLHPVLWSLPLLGLATSGYSLFALADGRRMLGRSAALVGLALSLMFGVAAPVRTAAYYWLEKEDARQFAMNWFEALRRGEIHQAHQMSTLPGDRKPINENLPALYEQSPDLQSALENYRKTPVVATLLSLGERATVRHYQSEAVKTDRRDDLVEDVYAVSFEEHGRKKTFFVKLNLWRNLRGDAGARVWRVQSPEGGYRPQGW